MTNLRSDAFLRTVLAVDAVASGATGLLLAAGAGFLAPVLGLPETLLRSAGLVLLPFVAFVAWAASRSAAPAGGVKAIIAVNALWTALSLLLVAAGPVTPTLLGYAFVIAQALAVGLLGELQWMALRRAPAAA